MIGSGHDSTVSRRQDVEQEWGSESMLDGEAWGDGTDKGSGTTLCATDGMSKGEGGMVDGRRGEDNV